MQDTLRDLISVHWWITVAIASLVLNVAASYLRGGLDRILPRLSSRFSFWTRKKVTEFTHDIDLASRDVSLMTYLAARQAGCHIAAMHQYVLMFLFFYVGGKVKSSAALSTALLCIGALFSIAGAWNYGRAMRHKTILDAVEKRARTAQPGAPPNGGPATASTNSGATVGPPSVS
jgi:hypothetical protein